jgi:hypothetical protein
VEPDNVFGLASTDLRTAREVKRVAAFEVTAAEGGDAATGVVKGPLEIGDGALGLTRCHGRGGERLAGVVGP